MTALESWLPLGIAGRQLSASFHGRLIVASDTHSGSNCVWQFGQRHRSCEQIALALVAAFASEELPVCFRLDAFRKHRHTESFALRAARSFL